MKVFVYLKKNNYKVAQICNVVQVIYHGSKIEVINNDNASFIFDTKVVKTRIYQN